MKLKDVEVVSSCVYIITQGKTYRYDKDICSKYGDLYISGIHIIKQSIYIELRRM